MKHVVLIILLACLSFFSANAQESPLEEGEQPLDMLVAETLDALMDTLSTFNQAQIGTKAR